MTTFYGLIGCGMMGREHLHNIALLKDAVVSVIYEPDKEMAKAAAALAPGAVFVDSVAALLAHQPLNCLVIVSPNHCHVEQLEEIAKQVCLPILVEKPLFTAVDDLHRVMQLKAHYGATIWVEMEYRYMPPMQEFIKMAAEVTGGLKMLTITEHRFPFLEKVGNWNRFNKNSGGSFVEKCCHFFDLMRLIIQSKPLSVYASGGQDVNHLDEVYNGKKPDIIDNAYVIVNFENGARSLLELCMFAENSDMQEELVATGNKGKIETSVPSDDSGKTSSNIRIGMRDGKTHVENIEVDKKILEAGHHHGSTYYEHLAFLKAIENNSDPEVSLEDGLIAVAVGEAAEQSIKQGRLINLEEIIN